MYNVIDYLKSSAEKYDNKIAIIEEDKSITYSDFNDRSKRVGSFLGLRFFFNEPIIMFMDKGIDTLTAFFGAAYAGCFYSLVNPELPANRIGSIREVLKPRVVITDEEHIALAKELFDGLDIYDIKEIIKSDIDEKVLEKAQRKHIDTDPLYVNFTSGSTGVPKGVAIAHRSVIEFIDIFTEIFDFKNEDIIANQAPFDFDVSVKDIFSSVKMGATLVIIPKKYFSSPAALLDYICDNKVTTLTWAVSALCLVTTFHGLDYKCPDTVKKILFSGEIMPVKHLKQWMEHLPEAEFVNLYGPTEITCNCTYHVIDKDREYDGKIPIGRAFPNERIYLLDENGNLIDEAGKSGEICIAGNSVGLGYYNNDDQTEKAFVYNPYVKAYKERIYKTGDLGYYNDEGELIFNGRKDYQVKYQGHRIELEEVDKAIMDVDGVVRSCTIFDEEKSKLYAFYIGDMDKKELNLKLRETMPVYMMPTYLIKRDEFPMTKNGKIDRKKLMEERKKK
ncbi:MAG: amino acid adenylation domain-containing protein [Lachnospiraceae bacterium]|nr:amino acid adenylation domain-containing protein [Lachnospiraceae bacterium]MBQ9233324.1 amino acid adenylation domain-containing protein [Lachnospiraceae bacterium]